MRQVSKHFCVHLEIWHETADAAGGRADEVDRLHRRHRLPLLLNRLNNCGENEINVEK